MTFPTDPHAPGYARLAGALYLAIAVLGAFSIGYVPSVIEVAGDVPATLANLAAMRSLHSLGIAADVAVMVIEILLLTMLYFMFRSVNETLAFAAALARFAMVVVMAAMLFFQAGVLALIDMSGGGTAWQEIAVAAFLEMHHAGVWIWQVFFGLHLVLLGRLVAASGRFPPVLGVLLSVGALGYWADSLYAFAFPDAAWLGLLRIALLAIVVLGEVGFALWLLLRGPRPQHRGAGSAS